MPGLDRFRRALPFLGLAAVACSILGVSLALPGAEALLDRGFDTALAEARRSDGSHTSRSTTLPGDYLWLSRAEQAEPLAFLGPVAVGDRMTISGADGDTRVLHVEDVREIIAPTRLESGAEPRLLMVTCRIVGSDQAKPVRFIVEADQPEAARPAAAKARVL